ncbi:hypothetical protein MTR67_002258 [Solanum verrucosum]|uniref:Uncharacterized protein n=1 Tax=Solanum verrucosum TaxID=315347 RepID=A0AAF0T977_SOLVR|nr:hypothetical protein MTR67_002258 [Solanum verrucosum]
MAAIHMTKGRITEWISNPDLLDLISQKVIEL